MYSLVWLCRADENRKKMKRKKKRLKSRESKKKRNIVQRTNQWKYHFDGKYSLLFTLHVNFTTCIHTLVNSSKCSHYTQTRTRTDTARLPLAFHLLDPFNRKGENSVAHNVARLRSACALEHCFGIHHNFDNNSSFIRMRSSVHFDFVCWTANFGHKMLKNHEMI